MTNERAKVGLDYAVSAFQKILGVAGRRFGIISRAEHGISDGVEGVQWNIKVDQDTEEALLGVNLEGMKYGNWPIATFIENELTRSRLLEIATRVKNNQDVWVAFYRDAWQVSVRAHIDERSILQATLSELSASDWKRALEEAYACLEPTRNHRGRTQQVVTLLNRGHATMDVSPHLHIYTTVWDTTPLSEVDARMRIQRGFDMLKSVHEFVVSQATGLRS